MMTTEEGHRMVEEIKANIRIKAEHRRHAENASVETSDINKLNEIAEADRARVHDDFTRIIKVLDEHDVVQWRKDAYKLLEILYDEAKL